MSDLATLKIVVDASGAIRAVDGFGHAVEGTAKKTATLTTAVGGLVSKFVGVAALVKTMQTFVQVNVEAQYAVAQLEATIRATGNASDRTLAQLNAHADALSRITGVSNDLVAAGQGRLLTYYDIQGAMFERATTVALDMATALGRGRVSAEGMASAAETVGKALNYPSNAMAALAKQGFRFTEAQQQQIKYFEETNQLAKAQEIVMGELEGSYKGVADAARDTLGGALRNLNTQLLELFKIQEQSDADALRDWVDDIADAFRLLPTYIKIATESLKNFGLQYASFFELPQDRIMEETLAKLSGTAPAPSAASRLDDSNALLAGLNALIAEQRAAIAEERKEREARRADRKVQAGGSGGGGGGGLTATADELAAIERVIAQHHKDSLEATKFRLDQALAVDDAVRAVEEQYHRDSLEASQYRLDQAQATDDAVRALEDQYYRDAEEAFRNRVDAEMAGMEQVTSVAQRLAGILGGSTGAVLGGIAGGIASVITGNVLGGAMTIASTLADKMFGRSQWEETIGDLNRAIRAQAEAAAELAFATKQGLAQWRDDFLNFANTETPEERQKRGITNQYNALATDAFDLANASGVSFTHRMMNFIRDGDWERALQVAGTDMFGNAEAIQNFIESLGLLGDAFEENLKAVDRMAAAERALSHARTVDNLDAFHRDIRSSSLSIYNPLQQQDDARAYYEEVLARAQGGDTSAAGELPAAARAFLEQSRRINASGSRYTADFQRVEADTLGVRAWFENQRTIEQAIADGLEHLSTGILDLTEQEDVYWTESNTIAQSQLDVTVAAAEETIAVLHLLIERVDEQIHVTKTGFEELVA